MPLFQRWGRGSRRSFLGQGRRGSPLPVKQCRAVSTMGRNQTVGPVGAPGKKRAGNARTLGPRRNWGWQHCVARYVFPMELQKALPGTGRPAGRPFLNPYLLREHQNPVGEAPEAFEFSGAAVGGPPHHRRGWRNGAMCPDFAPASSPNAQAHSRAVRHSQPPKRVPIPRRGASPRPRFLHSGGRQSERKRLTERRKRVGVHCCCHLEWFCRASS